VERVSFLGGRPPQIGSFHRGSVYVGGSQMEFLHRDRVREKGITPGLEETIFHAMGRSIQIAAMTLDM